MILLAVIVGYILGVLPFITLKILEIREGKKQEEEHKKENKEQAEIFDEWLNGEKEQENNRINQQDIFEEYMTGVASSKGE